MADQDYMEFGGVEIVNATRTAAYAEALGLYWVKTDGLKPNPDLPSMLGQDPYLSPSDETNPWREDDNPNSLRFAGAIPVEISGIEDSTRTAGAFEFTDNGGRSIGIRSEMKEVVFSLALIGADEAAVEYGHRWLKRALEQRDCVPKNLAPCSGETLTFASSRPTGTQWADFERNLRYCTLIRGPLVTSKRSFGGQCGGAVWLVSFTLRAGDPFEYGPPIPLLRGFGGTANPYVPGQDGDWGRNTFSWTSCSGQVVRPITDPNCRPFDAPPGPPNIGRGCFDFPTGTWSRAYAHIPAALVPSWDEVRPVFTITSEDNSGGDGEEEVRMLRLRVFSGDEVPTENCGSLAGVVLSYVPPETELIVDNSREYVIGRGLTESRYRRADALAAHWLGGPVEWYGLSCDTDYYLVMDWAGTDEPNVSVDVDFVARTF